MKLNNKGYAITIIVFGILIVFIIVLSSLLVTMNNSVKLNKTVKEDIIENIQLNADTTGMSLIERIELLEVSYNELLKTSTENYNQLSDQITTTKQDTIDEIYPVGSVYISTTDDEVSDVVARFGGEWEAYSQGRTLVGVGTGTDINGNVSTFAVNDTGGEYSHILTENEMPSHTHIQNSHNHGVLLHYSGYSGWNEVTIPKGVYYINWGSTVLTNPGMNSFTGTAGNGYTGVTNAVIATNQNTGGSQSHNNVQPYITVYMYKRIK